MGKYYLQIKLVNILCLLNKNFAIIFTLFNEHIV